MSDLKPGTKCYLDARRLDQIGAVVEVIEYPAGYEGGKDVCYVQDFPGEKFFTDRRNLRPVVDPAAADTRAKYANFSPYQGMVEYYDKLSPEEQEGLRKEGFF